MDADSWLRERGDRRRRARHPRGHTQEWQNAVWALNKGDSLTNGFRRLRKRPAREE
eukprot:COSAG02_NODE_6592_length_3474_cov_1.889185_1_plen_55_part_10